MVAPSGLVYKCNARLIAAAPELLAALREMERCGVLDNGMIAGPAKQARAALAKADGTDPGLEAHRREKRRRETGTETARTAA